MEHKPPNQHEQRNRKSAMLDMNYPLPREYSRHRVGNVVEVRRNGELVAVEPADPISRDEIGRTQYQFEVDDAGDELQAAERPDRFEME
jgi:hypothetical protein